MPVLLCGLESLKRIFSFPISTSFISLIMETGTWPANQKIQHKTMTFYRNIINSANKRVARKILAEQTKENTKGP